LAARIFTWSDITSLYMKRYKSTLQYVHMFPAKVIGVVRPGVICYLSPMAGIL